VSHFTNVKTKIKNRACLVRALEAMSYTVESAEDHQKVQVRGYQGKLEDADLKVKVSNTYDIGFKLTADGTYQIVSEDEMLEYSTGFTLDEFTKRVTRGYAYQTVKQEIEKKGWTLEQEEQGEQIHLHVRTWS
jgi:hypothetical protein